MLKFQGNQTNENKGSEKKLILIPYMTRSLINAFKSLIKTR